MMCSRGKYTGYGMVQKEVMGNNSKTKEKVIFHVVQEWREKKGIDGGFPLSLLAWVFTNTTGL